MKLSGPYKQDSLIFPACSVFNIKVDEFSSLHFMSSYIFLKQSLILVSRRLKFACTPVTSLVVNSWKLTPQWSGLQMLLGDLSHIYSYLRCKGMRIGHMLHDLPSRPWCKWRHRVQSQSLHLSCCLIYKHHFNAILETYVNKILHYLNIYILASCCYKVVCAARLIVISSIVTIYIALLDTAL